MSDHSQDSEASYEKPTITDLGDLRELTKSNSTATQRDVQYSTPVPPFAIFS